MQHARRVLVDVTRPSRSLRLTPDRSHKVCDGLRIARRGLSSTASSSLQRLSQFWIPTGGIDAGQDGTHSQLLRAGYLRQAHSGIFHLLPLGNRVQQKLEQLIDKHMTGLGASKVSLSSITTEELWEKSGRLEGHGSELFKFMDRKEGKFLLSPTHEEEITSLVASTTKSYRDLPIRLYQVSRKYRDEQRPRGGLLRGREFLMKDLYTFDLTAETAKETYEQVRVAYRAFLDELKLPYLVAKADSGSMGGNLSHEYHFVSLKGEDYIISCDSCGHTINEELAITAFDKSTSLRSEDGKKLQTTTWYGLSKDRRILIEAVFPRYTLTENSPTARQWSENEISIPAVKAALPDVDLVTNLEDARSTWTRDHDSMSICLVDPRLPPGRHSTVRENIVTEVRRARAEGNGILLTRTLPGDSCPSCQTGRVKVDQAIEIGHTFHLGTRYSKPLNAAVRDQKDKLVHLEMGCHGIGVSRLIAAIASTLSDEQGLQWPAAIAPFNVVVVPSGGENLADAEQVCATALTEPEFDVLLDDRVKGLGWKLKDADLIGYPIQVIFGKTWSTSGQVEVQCRRLGVKKFADPSELRDTVKELLAQL